MEAQTLGAIDHILQWATGFVDHAYHGRPGVVTPTTSNPAGAQWVPAQKKDGCIHLLSGKTVGAKLGTLTEDGSIRNDRGVVVGSFRESGLFDEVVVAIYSKIADVYLLNQEFVAKWASWAFTQQNKDMKVLLAAFLLVQSRKGDPIKDSDGKVEFYDDDLRTVGEAMGLLRIAGGGDLNPRLILRIRDVLNVPGVAKINQRLGFSGSEKPFLGRWPRMVTKWLKNREDNPKLLESAVSAGFSGAIKDMARAVGYKPSSDAFFKALRWKQRQAEGGHRQIAIGEAVAPALDLEGLTEGQLIDWIQKNRPSYKRLVGLLPKSVGLTRNVIRASIVSGGVSDKDIIIMTPTIEDYNLLTDPMVKEKWERATQAATDQRARTVMKNVRTEEAKVGLEKAVEAATEKAAKKVLDVRVYLIVDISGSMQAGIHLAKEYIALLLQGFPLDRLHVATFNTVGQEVVLKSSSKAGVENAFSGINAGGGTQHAQGVRALAHRKPKDGEAALFIFVGDEEEDGRGFANVFTDVGIRPSAFALVRIGNSNCHIVTNTAAALRIPCFPLEKGLFSDSYRIPEILSNLMMATPPATPINAVATFAPRVSLAEVILKTDLLVPPVWARA